MELNQKVPNWELETIFNDTVPSLESLEGKPILIVFFNLGCFGCKGRALPYANRVVFENGDNINVIGIHTRFEGSKYQLEDFQKAKDDYFIRFPFFKDKGRTTFDLYNAGGTPHWLLLNKNGELEYSIFGSDPNNALLRLDLRIKELLF